MKALPVLTERLKDLPRQASHPLNRSEVRDSLRAFVSGLPLTEVAPDAHSLALRFSEMTARCLIHAFEYRGTRYLVDPITGTLFRMQDDDLFRLGQALASGLEQPALARLIEHMGLAKARTMHQDLLRLSTETLMFRRDQMSMDGLIARAVEQYLDHRPRKMMLCVSQTCNLRCVYCYAIEGNYHDEGRLMSLETAQQSIRFLAARAGPRRSLTVTLFGGEPLINFEMIKKLVPWSKAWARTVRKRVHFCITTNGTLLSDEVIEFLIEHQFSVMISLDGPKELQDLSRPNASGKGSFDTAAPRIRRLLDRHPHPEIVKVRATLTHQNHDTVALVKFFEEFGFKRVGIGANVGYSFYKGPFDLKDEDREDMYRSSELLLDEELDGAFRSYQSATYDPISSSLLATHEDRDRIGPRVKMPCGVGRNDQGIDVDGKVYPCHRYVGMQAYVIGDIWKGVNQETLGAFYTKVLQAYSECHGCWANRWCSGHCPNYLSDPVGRVFGPDEPACDALRGSVERHLALYQHYTDLGMDWERFGKSVGA